MRKGITSFPHLERRIPWKNTTMTVWRLWPTPSAAAPLFALPAVLAWGLATIWLSPCHLAGVPLVVGWLAATPVDSARPAPRRPLG